MAQKRPHVTDELLNLLGEENLALLEERTVAYCWKFVVWRDDEHICKYCKIVLDHWKFCTIDHVEPVSKGGQWTRANLVLACKPCNESKADKSLSEWSAIGVRYPQPFYPPKNAKRLSKMQQELSLRKRAALKPYRDRGLLLDD